MTEAIALSELVKPCVDLYMDEFLDAPLDIHREENQRGQALLDALSSGMALDEYQRAFLAQIITTYVQDLTYQRLFHITPEPPFPELPERLRKAAKLVEVIQPLVSDISGFEKRCQVFIAEAKRLRFSYAGGRPLDWDILQVEREINAICADLASRNDVVHLLVIWPTAVAEPAWFAHQNTVVVRTHHAGVLVAAADVFVSAVGYNSFHEAIYNSVPTIFVPQMAPFMDDQRARAISAAEREPP